MACHAFYLTLLPLGIPTCSSADTAVERVEPGQPEKKEEDERRNARLLARRKAKRKRFACDIPGCNKMFAEKKNLANHLRSHTGESPYECPYCNRSFTQSVNLKAYTNRHTGERPYECSECPKAFPQLSNLKAHVKTHVRRELRDKWICWFCWSINCQKTFTLKGNLKAHQNTYHVGEIEAFNSKLVDGSVLSESEKNMAAYLAEVHNLANKGIKGRGKGRKVKRVSHPPRPPHQQQQSFPSTSPIGTTVYAAPCPMPLPNHHYNTLPRLPPIADPSLYGLSNPAACSMDWLPPTAMVFGYGGPPLSLNISNSASAHNHHHGAYADQFSDASSVHEPTPVLYTYNEEHG
ncbi:hypothetical protein N658DRAFT_94956 [Parathielavia hyrcaniae]|uniref:C2H2 type master regulator of conidiophore development brlA n=1 Tax=Parathielavia hyrcaniae TaxID=113614 RepID=A0AAN6PPX0_9PEZI|nr:hypothetical protein N658DRAFT_94956 [Parathielavia hyrcaniae]